MGSCTSKPRLPPTATPMDDAKTPRCGITNMEDESGTENAKTSTKVTTRIDKPNFIEERAMLFRMAKKHGDYCDHISVNCENEYVDSATLTFSRCQRRMGADPNEHCPPPQPNAIFDGLLQLQRITHLELCNFPLAKLPESIGDLTSLERLTISGSPDALVEIPKSIGKLQNLAELKISGCNLLGALPAEIGQLENLIILDFHSCLSLTTLPSELGNLRSLKRLQLIHLLGLEMVPDEIGSLGALESLVVQSCPSLSRLPSSIGRLQSLKELHVTSWSSLGPVALDIPVELRECKSLREICLRHMLPVSVLKLFSEPWDYPPSINEASTTKSGYGGATLTIVRLTSCALTNEHVREILPNLPASLTVLDLFRNKVSSFDVFLQSGLPPRLRKLLLPENLILESVEPLERSNLTQLLNTYRHIGWLDRKFGVGGKIFNHSHLYTLLLNGNGRGLIGDRQRLLPLSVWPTVLARASASTIDDVSSILTIHHDSREDHELNASVIYELLHGPALLGPSA